MDPNGVCCGKSTRELQELLQPWQYCDLFATAFDAYQVSQSGDHSIHF